jgi:hypothetical protein
LLSDIGFPGADEPSVFTAPRVDNDLDPATYLAQAPDPCLTIVEAIIYAFEDFALEQGQHIDKIEFVIA